MIVAPTKTEVKGIKYLQKLDIPFVLVDRYYQNMETNYVIVDNFGSAYELVNFLITKGARKIAILVTDAHLFVMKQRVEGYSAALRESGVVDDYTLKVFVDRQTYKVDVYEKLDCLFQDVPDVDGFFFTTHYLAMAAICYMVKRGIDFHRFKMGVFHTMAGLDVLAPEMSSMVFPIEKLGAESVNILLNNICEGKEFVLQAKVLQNTFLPCIGEE